MSITRRLLLGSAGVAALGVVTYVGSRGVCRFVHRNHPDFFSLLDIAPDEPAARRIGQGALAANCAPNGLEAIAQALAERPLIRAALDDRCPTTLKTAVGEQCALDFAESRTVVIDGWVLSETEARLCAARALQAAVI